MSQRLDFSDIIKERANFLGITNSQLASIAGVSQSQISSFLNKNSSISLSAVEKIFEQLGINISTYDNRLNLAKFAADKLIDAGYKVKEVKHMSKYSMANVVGDNRITFLIDNLIDSDYDDISNENESIIPVECTYAYFKMMVMHCMEMDGKKITPKSVKDSYSTLNNIVGYALAGSLLGSGNILGLGILAALYKTITNDGKEEERCFAPLVNLAKKLLG